MRSTNHVPVLAFGLALLAASLGLPACQGRTSAFSSSGGGNARPARGLVELTAQDLAPVDAYIHHNTAGGASNTKWIVGDHVEIVASREYFGQNLTFTRASGLVERVDATTPDETKVTLNFLGVDGSESVLTNPRVLLGTGFTVSARRTLVVRLVRTLDSNRPVYLNVTAKGLASRGRLETVEERAPLLRMGGELRRSTDGRYRWTPFG